MRGVVSPDKQILMNFDKEPLCDRPDGAHRAVVGRREMIARRTIAKAALLGLMICLLLVSVSQGPRMCEWAGYGV